MKKEIPTNYLDAIKVTIVTNTNKTFTKKITSWVTTGAVHIDNLRSYINNPNVIDFELTFPKVKTKIGFGSSNKNFIAPKKLNLDIPIEIMSDLLTVANSKGAGCTKKIINKFNKFLSFDLHEVMGHKYGFTGASKLHSIFKV